MCLCASFTNFIVYLINTITSLNFFQDGKYNKLPSILKSFQGKQFTITINITEKNVKEGSNMYTATNIFEGFELTEESATTDVDRVIGLKDSEVCLICKSHPNFHLTLILIQIMYFQISASTVGTPKLSDKVIQTPGTENSTNTNTLKRKSSIFVDDDKVTYIGDDGDGDEDNVGKKNKQILLLKEIKKEKVNYIIIIWLTIYMYA